MRINYSANKYNYSASIIHNTMLKLSLIVLAAATLACNAEEQMISSLPVCWVKGCAFFSQDCAWQSYQPETCAKPTYGLTNYEFSANKSHVEWNTRVIDRTAVSHALRLCVFKTYTCDLSLVCLHVSCIDVPARPMTLSSEMIHEVPWRILGNVTPSVVGSAILYVCVQREVIKKIDFFNNSPRPVYVSTLVYDHCVTTSPEIPVVGNLYRATAKTNNPLVRWSADEKMWLSKNYLD